MSSTIGVISAIGFASPSCMSRTTFTAVMAKAAVQSTHERGNSLNGFARFPHRIQAVKTDHGSIFTNSYTGTNKRSDMTVKTIHAFDVFCHNNAIVHYLIDPGKPAQNGTVERSHREDQEKFYETHIFNGFPDLQKKLKRWNMYYNNLEHCGLNGKTPNEVLAEYQLTNPPNVCA